MDSHEAGTTTGRTQTATVEAKENPKRSEVKHHLGLLDQLAGVAANKKKEEEEEEEEGNFTLQNKAALEEYDVRVQYDKDAVPEDDDFYLDEAEYEHDFEQEQKQSNGVVQEARDEIPETENSHFMPIHVLPLFARLSSIDQMAAFEAPPEGHR